MNKIIESVCTAVSVQRRHAGGRLIIAAAFSVSLWSATGGNAASADPNTSQENPDYAAGYRFGVQLAELHSQGKSPDMESVLRGMLDALSSTRASSTASSRPGSKIPAREGAYIDDYAALNAQRPGVVVLPSGLQYEILKAGDGKRPGQQDIVAVNYRGFLATGVTFDSTDAESGPAHLRIDQIVIQGLKEAILLMRVGDNWRVTIPASLGFIRKGMLRKRDLIYEIELIAIEAPPGDP